MRKIQFLFVIAVLVLLASCKTLNNKVTHKEMVASASESAKKLVGTPDFKSCEQGHKVIGTAKLKNNLWGKSKLKKGTAELCTFLKDDLCGWEWKIDNAASGVIGYPALEVGRSPWGGKQRAGNNGFPIPVDDIGTLSVSYDFETLVKHKKYNLAFDIWLTNEEKANKDNITTEIMIWEDYFSFSSYGKIIEEIITPFGVYKVYRGYLENKKFNQDWVYLAFVRKNPRSSGEVDIQYFLDYLVKNKHISGKDYFASVELGNEIGNSSGLTLVKSFDWELKAK